jgi:hypothetical protein
MSCRARRGAGGLRGVRRRARAHTHAPRTRRARGCTRRGPAATARPAAQRAPAAAPTVLLPAATATAAAAAAPAARAPLPPCSCGHWGTLEAGRRVRPRCAPAACVLRLCGCCSRECTASLLLLLLKRSRSTAAPLSRRQRCVCVCVLVDTRALVSRELLVCGVVTRKGGEGCLHLCCPPHLLRLCCCLGETFRARHPLVDECVVRGAVHAAVLRSQTRVKAVVMGRTGA